MDIEDIGMGMGIIGLIILAIILILVPLIATIILGVFVANMLGLTGIVWWAFLVVFYIIVMGLISLITNR